MNRNTPGLPVHHQLLEFTEIHVHWVSDAIQPSHPLSFPSPPAPNSSQQHWLIQDVFKPQKAKWPVRGFPLRLRVDLDMVLIRGGKSLVSQMMLHSEKLKRLNTENFVMVMMLVMVVNQTIFACRHPAYSLAIPHRTVQWLVLSVFTLLR